MPSTPRGGSPGAWMRSRGRRSPRPASPRASRHRSNARGFASRRSARTTPRPVTRISSWSTTTDRSTPAPILARTARHRPADVQFARASTRRSASRPMTRARDQLRRVRSLLDDIEAVVWESDATGAFTLVSAGAERLLGYPPDAWRADGFLAEHVHPDDRRTVLGTIASAIRQRRPLDVEFRMLHRDGSTVWVRALARPASDAAVTRGLLIDVTRHRLEEDRGSEIELRYQRLIEHLPAIVYTESVAEDQAVVVYVSPQVRSLLGVDPADWIGSSAGWLSRVHEDDRTRIEAANAESDRTGRPFAEEYRMWTGHGNLVWFHDESVLVRDDDGRPL